jgi:hypothetical protein
MANIKMMNSPLVGKTIGAIKAEECEDGLTILTLEFTDGSSVGFNFHVFTKVDGVFYADENDGSEQPFRLTENKS